MAKREPWNPLLKSYPESEKINSCSMDAETMYTRLIAKSDDNANFYGDPALMASYLFGHRLANGTITVTKTKRMRDELVTEALLKKYIVDRREYVHILDCKKALRTDIKRDERFPEFTETLVAQAHPESVTNPLRKRNEPVTDSARQPNPTPPNLDPTQLEGDCTFFELWWRGYPGTSAEKGSKVRAIKKWDALLKNGTTAEEITKCRDHYAAYLGSLNWDRRPMNAAKFLGPDRHFDAYAEKIAPSPLNPQANVPPGMRDDAPEIDYDPQANVPEGMRD